MTTAASEETSRTDRYPVLVIPGYGAPQFQTDRVGRMIQEGGLDVVKIKLPWMGMGDMRRYAGLVSERVGRLREYLGHERVNFFGFSLGGIVVRYYLQELGGYPALGRAAFVSSPNAGTRIGYLGFFSPAGLQVRTGSPLIRALNESPLCEEIAGRCLSIFVRWDGVIVPHESSYMPSGFNLFEPRPLTHWRAVMSGELVNRACEFLKGGMPPGAVPGAELILPEAGDITAVPWTPPERRSVRQVAYSPVRSLGTWIASLFRRSAG